MAMSSSNDKPDFLADLRRDLSNAQLSIIDQWNALAAAFRNQLRLLRKDELDYIFLPVGGVLPERDPPPRTFIERQLPLPPLPLSMQLLNYRLQAIADAENVKGVIFVFRGFDSGLATLQNFRRAVQRLRDCGKEAVVFTPYLDLAHYYAATAADKIVVPPSSQFNVLGLRAEIMYFKDVLRRVGIEAEAIQSSPYKSAPNVFSRSDMTPEERQQLDWQLDDWFNTITAEMAAGRQKTPDEIRELIDGAPYFADEALDLGLVDHISYEDELAYLLARKDDPRSDEPPTEENVQEKNTEALTRRNEKARPKAKLMTWAKARGMLLEKPRRHSRKYIGIISLQGTIMMGPSHQSPLDFPIPFVGGSSAGEQTLVKLLRHAEKSAEMAALILHIDSGGGSSLASDLIGRQIKRISQKKPVLAYMGNAAASGGYYVAAPASHIMSQVGTITGSIGVWSLHFSTRDLYTTININRVNLERGKRAGLYSDDDPLTEEERQIFVKAIRDAYDKFKTVVADGRDLPFDELDSICEGRVWTGKQALDHKLVDSHGDFVDALQKVAELAGLPFDEAHEVEAVNLYSRGEGYISPKAYEAAEAVAKIGHWLVGERWRQLSGQPLMMMPFDIRIL